MFGYVCPTLGRNFTEADAPVYCECGDVHQVFPCGAPPAEAGMPNICGDELRKHFDWSVGAEVTSKSQRRRLYAQKGMIEKSSSEYYREHGAPAVRGRGYSYAGQTSHKSTAEKSVLR